MKLYTEEQVKRVIIKAWIPSHFGGFLYNERQLLESLTPIELPSDEEIKKEAKSNCEYNQDSLRQFDSKFMDTFIDGAKWMKEQILNQNINRNIIK